MNLYVIEAERPQADKKLIKEVQYVVAGSLRTALNWVTRTGTPEEEIVGIRCACPVVAIVSDDANKEITTKNPYHCPLDGEQLIEIGLGMLMCRRCETQFVPTLGPSDGEAGLSWTQNAAGQTPAAQEKRHE